MAPGIPRRGIRRTAVAVAAGALMLGTAAATAPGAAAAPTPDAKATSRPASDVRSIAHDKLIQQRHADLTKAERARFARQADRVARAQQAQRGTAAPADGEGTGGTPIGGEKVWLGLDNAAGGYFAATYVLRGVGDNIEVWVQSDLNYPQGDCRNDGVRNVITDEQVNSLVGEYDDNMLPKESEAFSVAPPRDGTDEVDVGFGAPLWQILGDGDPNYFKGDGGKTVALISNVRDANFYDPTSPNGATYIAGFFSPLFNEGFDRNVMTIDSYDWKHRTGANPPDEGDGGLCSPLQPARPRLYEGTFAHEYQHLLEYYQDGDEVTWLNEGMSDWAQSLVGYVDTTLRYPALGADSHIACFEGWYGREDFPFCGAENSMTRWLDQGSPSVLSDYGAAYSFLTWFADQFGESAMSYLHTNPANGLAAVQNYLDDHAPGLSATDAVHDWLAAEALDGFLDDGAKGLSKDERRRFSAENLHGGIDWAWTGSYDTPGAPTNGADYVLARTERPLNGDTVGKLSFRGTKTYAPDPVEWAVDGGALYTGQGNELDRSLVYQVDVPADEPMLTFSTRYDIELGWDFGVVQVSTDGGKTYTSLSNEHTTSEHNPAAEGRIVDELPGLTGTQADFATETFDLSAYAGQTVYLSFRYLTDPATNGNGEGTPGWWVKDVMVGSNLVTDGTSLDGAQSITQISPIPVEGWSVQLVGWTLDGDRVAYRDLRLKEKGQGFFGHVGKGAMKRTFRKMDRIGVLVTVDDPGEAATKYANYVLRLNGQVQPGGVGGTSAAQLPRSSQLSFH